jgi:hypothetical protein
MFFGYNNVAELKQETPKYSGAIIQNAPYLQPVQQPGLARKRGGDSAG